MGPALGCLLLKTRGPGEEQSCLRPQPIGSSVGKDPGLWPLSSQPSTGPLWSPSSACGWEGVEGALGYLSVPVQAPSLPCLLRLPQLQAWGLQGSAWLLLRLGGESESCSPSTKPHCSQQTLPGSGAFFSNDSAAREWEGPSFGNATKACGVTSHRAHREEGLGLGSGSCQGPGGSGRPVGHAQWVFRGDLSLWLQGQGVCAGGSKWTGNGDGRAGLHGDGHPVANSSRVC